MKTTETYTMTIEREQIAPNIQMTTMKIRSHQSGLERVWTVSSDFSDHAIGSQLGFIFKELRWQEKTR